MAVPGSWRKAVVGLEEAEEDIFFAVECLIRRRLLNADPASGQQGGSTPIFKFLLQFLESTASNSADGSNSSSSDFSPLRSPRFLEGGEVLRGSFVMIQPATISPHLFLLSFPCELPGRN